MRRSTTLWTLAIVITLASAVYQRVTGPTYPLRVKTKISGNEVSARLLRTFAGPGDAEVRIPAPTAAAGTISWKRFKTSDAWTYAEMQRQGSEFVGVLPHQPPAGKLQYRVILQTAEERVSLGGAPVVIRFRGDVPLAVMVVHVLAMFLGMLLATRAGLEYFNTAPSYRTLVLWTVILLTAGGMIFGPIMQKYAFGAYWTGWPFGTDLTDNKTAVAWLAWLGAWWALRRSSNPGRWILAASIITLVVFAIPHSVLGSELDYSQTPPAK